jgi:predicted AlkP superfamily pyrophosphatase or phosphodiesterase
MAKLPDQPFWFSPIQPMTKIFRLALGLLAVCLCSCSTRPPKTDDRYAPLILVSIDGYRADYLDRGLSPNLAALAHDGVRAQALKPAFPTLTFPNHYTIVTGLYPDHHGIVNNRFIDPATGEKFVYNDQKTIENPAWWGGEPLWVGAERQGKHAATMFWPGSDLAIDGVRPEHWRSYDAKVSADARVTQLLQWLDLPAGERPDFLTLYFEQVDHAGHDHGPDSSELDAALREVDAALGRLRVGLRRRGLVADTNLVVVSDHGMAGVDESRIIVLDRLVDLHLVELSSVGVLTELAATPGHEAEVERVLLAPHEHLHCWRKNEIPPRLRYGANARIPPLLCLADDGWRVETQAYLDRPNRHHAGGEHGYDNDDPNMRALFVANGPAFRRGLVVPEFDNVDVYPLLTHVLGIRAAPNDGDFSVVAPLLAPAR